MKRLLLIIILVFPLSCYDGLGDMLDEVTMEVPVCVWDAAPGPVHDGRGWKNAYLTLADAVAAADEGDTIWVAGPQEVTATITISKSLTILGGFSGIESRRDQRDVDSHTVVSYLSAVSEVILISSQNVAFDNIRIQNVNSEGGAVTITAGSSVIFENCHFYNNQANSDSGGAISLDNADLQIRNCIFDGNKTTNNNTYGGAIYAVSDSNVIISDNTEFYRNSAASTGGAIFADASTVTITGSLFGDELTAGSGNSAVYAGGAIGAVGNSKLTISENTKFFRNKISSTGAGGAIRIMGAADIYPVLIVKNSIFGGATAGLGNTATSTGGAISAHYNSNVNISSSSFKGNSAGTYGGAVYVNGSNSVIADCDFKSNSALSNNGGALYFQASDSNKNLTIERSDFDSNSANGAGGAIYFTSTGLNSRIVMESCIVRNTPTDNGSAVSVISGTDNQFVNSLFYNNNLTTGTNVNGGALSIGSESLMVNLTFFNNSANSGGAVYLAGAGSTYYMYNTVFYNNTSTDGGTKDTLSTDINVFLNRYNCFYYNMDVYGGSENPGCITGNTSDPFLNSSDPSNLNFMRPGSILLNAGYTGNISGFTMPATDLAGNNREVGTVDIGAYERQ